MLCYMEYTVILSTTKFSALSHASPANTTTDRVQYQNTVEFQAKSNTIQK